jgi:beta-lactamase class A
MRTHLAESKRLIVVIVMVVLGLLLASLASPATTTVAQTGTIPVSTPPASVPVSTPVPTAPVAAPTPFPPAMDIVVPETREQQLAEELLANEPGVYGYVVMAADGSLVASINGQTPFVTASLYKLILMADIYQRIEMGSLSADQLIVLQPRVYLESLDNYFAPEEIGMAFPLQEYLFAVGAYSSNVAARTLLDLTSREALRNTISSPIRS